MPMSTEAKAPRPDSGSLRTDSVHNVESTAWLNLKPRTKSVHVSLRQAANHTFITLLFSVFSILPAGIALAVAGCNDSPPTMAQSTDADFSTDRLQMVESQIVSRGVRDPAVLQAMRTVPRHRFVPERDRNSSYRDGPLPIGHGQTISQPYIVAIMTELLGLADRPNARVLEVGTGCGYQAAVLGEIAAEVHTIEIVRPLCERARKILTELGYKNVHIRCGDGYAGWPEAAPFDGILVAAAPAEVPEPLLRQLKIGARLVIPVGTDSQRLLVITRTEDGFERRAVFGVRFVPMTGQARDEAN